MIYQILTSFSALSVKYFKTFFDDAMFDLIVTQSNLYFCQKTGKKLKHLYLLKFTCE